jgi:hypothetical protein
MTNSDPSLAQHTVASVAAVEEAPADETISSDTSDRTEARLEAAKEFQINTAERPVVSIDDFIFLKSMGPSRWRSRLTNPTDDTHALKSTEYPEPRVVRASNEVEWQVSDDKGNLASINIAARR